MNHDRILQWAKNMYALKTLSLKIAKFLWNECPIDIQRVKGDMDKIGFDDEGIARLIVIGEHPNRESMHTALLHEVGHYKDALKLSVKFMSKYLIDERRFEKAAWKHALRFSNQYGIPINYALAQEWLSTYGTRYRCLDNKLKAA